MEPSAGKRLEQVREAIHLKKLEAAVQHQAFSALLRQYREALEHGVEESMDAGPPGRAPPARGVE